MLVLIDNYDSFSYNLYQLLGTITPDIHVVRNDACSVDDLIALEPQGIVISPGPGRPENAGICLDVISRLAGVIPILGVCLGHQAICHALGAHITYAKTLTHGKATPITHTAASTLFHGLPNPMAVGRYHSLAVDAITLPESLVVTARSDDGEVMAVEDAGRNLYGVQFHPESILTPFGMDILKNFVERISCD